MADNLLDPLRTVARVTYILNPWITDLLHVLPRPVFVPRITAPIPDPLFSLVPYLHARKMGVMSQLAEAINQTQADYDKAIAWLHSFRHDLGGAGSWAMTRDSRDQPQRTTCMESRRNVAASRQHSSFTRSDGSSLYHPGGTLNRLLKQAPLAVSLAKPQPKMSRT